MDGKKPMTEKQRVARLENIRKARGPKTIAGKERSSRNATKHGGWARSLRAIDQGPLREDPRELEEFVNAYLAELNPGTSIVRRQAALDVADKAWRLTRAQRWEAEGYSAADYGALESTGAAWMRFHARRDRILAQALRQFPDDALSDDEVEDVLYTLGFAVGMSEEDLEWVETADRNAVDDGLATLLGEHFGDQHEAAVYLETRAAETDDEASTEEDMRRPDAIRRELDGSFARNAERLVSHASRELDRAMKRYQVLTERFGETEDQGEDDGRQLDASADSVPRGGDGHDAPTPPSDGTAGSSEPFDIFSRMSADEAVDFFQNLLVNPSSADPPARNEPTDPSQAA